MVCASRCSRVKGDATDKIYTKADHETINLFLYLFKREVSLVGNFQDISLQQENYTNKKCLTHP